MATYLYCVLSASGLEPPAISGVGGSDVRALSVNPAMALDAWVSTVSESAFRISGRELGAQALLHNAVVSAALESGSTPLPARFGSYFADDAACVSTLSAHGASLRETLQRLAGSVEMSVLIVPPRAAAATAKPLPMRDQPAAGRQYLEILRERSRRRESVQKLLEEVITRIGAAVQDIVRDETRSRRTAGIISIAHLMPREDAERYREAIRRVTAPDGVRLIVGGPRAPYSFVNPGVLSSGHDSSSPDFSA